MVRGGGSTSLLVKAVAATKTLQLPSLQVCIYCFLPGRATAGICLLRTLLGACGLSCSLPRPAWNPAVGINPDKPILAQGSSTGVACELLHQEIHLVLGAGHLLRVGNHQGPVCIGQTPHELHPAAPGGDWNCQQWSEKLSYGVPQHEELSFPLPQWMGCCSP